MKSFSFLLWLLFAVISTGACRQKAALQAEGAVGVSGQDAQSSSPNETVATRPPDEETSIGHDYTFLTQKLLVFNNVFGPAGPDGQPMYKDEWIDLLPDGTFKAGKKQEQTHAGRWGYNHDKTLLVIKPDDTSKHKMSEWRVQHNNDYIVLSGTSRFGNNAYQCQLFWSEQKPK